MFNKIKVFLKQKKLLHQLFEATILVKGINGIWETFSGLLFLFLSKDAIKKLVLLAVQREIVEDKADFISNYLVKTANNISISTKNFVAIYLIFYGVMNLFLTIFLLKKKLWAYPVAIGFHLVFLVYQIHRYFSQYSSLLFALIILDIFTIILIWLEYKKIKRGLVISIDNI